MIFLISFVALLILIYFWILFFLIKNLIYVLPILWGSPYVPVLEKEVDKILKLLDLKPGELFYDLGSGDGRILIEAARTFKVKAIGIEINPLLVFLSKRKVKKLELQERIKIIRGNFFKLNFSDADAISVYLIQTTLNRLEKKFLSELKPGTRIVSKSFTFENLPFVKSDLEKKYLRLYKT